MSALSVHPGTCWAVFGGGTESGSFGGLGYVGALEVGDDLEMIVKCCSRHETKEMNYESREMKTRRE